MTHHGKCRVKETQQANPTSAPLPIAVLLWRQDITLTIHLLSMELSNKDDCECPIIVRVTYRLKR